MAVTSTAMTEKAPDEASNALSWNPLEKPGHDGSEALVLRSCLNSAPSRAYCPQFTEMLEAERGIM